MQQTSQKFRFKFLFTILYHALAKIRVSPARYACSSWRNMCLYFFPFRIVAKMTNHIVVNAKMSQKGHTKDAITVVAYL